MDDMIEVYVWEFVINYLEAVEHEETKQSRALRIKYNYHFKRQKNYKYNTWRTRVRNTMKDKTEEHKEKGVKVLHHIPV